MVSEDIEAWIICEGVTECRGPGRGMGEQMAVHLLRDLSFMACVCVW